MHFKIVSQKRFYFPFSVHESPARNPLTGAYFPFERHGTINTLGKERSSPYLYYCYSHRCEFFLRVWTLSKMHFNIVSPKRFYTPFSVHDSPARNLFQGYAFIFERHGTIKTLGKERSSLYINYCLFAPARIIFRGFHRLGTKRRYYDSVQLDTIILLWGFIMEHDTR